MVLFETERMTVRRFTTEDAEAFFLVNGNPEVVKFIRPAKSRADSDAFLQENLNFYKEGSCLGRFAVLEKQTQQFLGSFSFLYLSGDADFHLGYALLPEAWGKGYATELVATGINYFFAHTDHLAIFAITQSENQASRNVLIKSGFLEKGQVEEYNKTLDLFYIIRGMQPSAHIETE